MLLHSFSGNNYFKQTTAGAGSLKHNHFEQLEIGWVTFMWQGVIELKCSCTVMVIHEIENVSDITDSQQSGMQQTQTIDMCRFLIDLLTLFNEAGQEQIKLLGANFYLQWLAAFGKKTFCKAQDAQTINSIFKQLMYEPFVLYSEEGWCLAAYQPSPAALSWLISLSLSLGHLLITNQKASLTSHKRRRTGETARDRPPHLEPRSTKTTSRRNSEEAGRREQPKGKCRCRRRLSGMRRIRMRPI